MFNEVKLKGALKKTGISIMEPVKSNYLDSENGGMICAVCDNQIGEKIYRNKAVCNQCLEDIKNM